MNIAYAYVINKQLHDTIIGKTLKNVIANQNPHTFVWFAMEPSQASQYNQIAAPEIAKYMINNVIEKCAVFNGAQNCLYIGDRVLMSDITPRFYNALERPPKKHQLLLEFEDGSILAYSASLGGVINLFQIDQNGLPMRANVNFPMILSNEFTYKFFHDIILKTDLKSLSVKQFLATKNRIPGIDNNLLQDILWDAQVNPKSKMKVLRKSITVFIIQLKLLLVKLSQLEARILTKIYLGIMVDLNPKLVKIHMRNHALDVLLI